MKFGLAYQTAHSGDDPDLMAGAARLPEECGFESLRARAHRDVSGGDLALSAVPAGPYEDREQPAATNTRILNAAARLFYRKGIRAVSVDEVAAEESVTKVTVYKHYRAKDQLLAACLHALDERFFTCFVHEVHASTDDPHGRLLAVFDVLGQWFQRRDFHGCAFVNTTVELASPDHPAGKP